MTYVKRIPEARRALRKAFDTSGRKIFLIKLSENEEMLKKAGLTGVDIQDMKEGHVPEGWQIRTNCH